MSAAASEIASEQGVEPLLARIARALHPLDAPPPAEAWNLGELAGLLPEPQRLADAAVLVGLLPRDDGLHVLFTVRTDALRHHAGQVSFPGGRLEPGDDGPAAAAMRETWEETGIPGDQIAPLGWLDPLATITGFRVLPLVARLDARIAPVPDPREVAAVFDVPFAHLSAPGHLRQVAIDYRGAQRHVAEVEPYAGGARIWGATASILQNLMARLAAADRPPGRVVEA